VSEYGRGFQAETTIVNILLKESGGKLSLSQRRLFFSIWKNG